MNSEIFVSETYEQEFLTSLQNDLIKKELKHLNKNCLYKRKTLLNS